jgi:hypothetical protein
VRLFVLGSFLLSSRVACYVSDAVRRYVLITHRHLGCGKRSSGFDYRLVGTRIDVLLCAF